MFRRVLVANRGEIAIRISRACSLRGIEAVAVFSRDDSQALHRSRADAAVELAAHGPRAYLDQAAVIEAALAADCDAVHPGYGFLSESGDFAAACRAAGLAFVGPSVETLEIFGDKARARALALQCDVPVADGTSSATGLDEAREFFAKHRASGLMVKALAGGGGRGMRAVRREEDLDEAWERCRSEAAASFGRADVYVEQLIGRARHIEIQIVGDGTDVTHLFDRECSIQRRHQKLIEIAPSPWLPSELRGRLIEASLRLGAAVSYIGVGTVEFMVEIDEVGSATGRYFFIELNPRIQVEHTVTEEVMGVDIVDAQLLLAAGVRLEDLGWSPEADRQPNGWAVQLRVNAEASGPTGELMPSAGTLETFDLPSGPGVRVETLGYRGLAVGAAFDPLLAKIITHSVASFDAAVAKGNRALGELHVVGVGTNVALLRRLLGHAAFREGRADTKFVETHADELLADDLNLPSYHPEAGSLPVLADSSAQQWFDGVSVCAPMQGQVTSYAVEPDERFARGQTLCVVEAMKMEYPIRAEQAGTVLAIAKPVGATVALGDVLIAFDPVEDDSSDAGGRHLAVESAEMARAVEGVEVEHRKRLDAMRPDTVALAERRGTGTARQRIEALIDSGTFSEIGGLASNPGESDVAPADGVVAGRASLGGRPVLILSQDFSVFGGSAGHLGMRKMERVADLALHHGMPLVMLLDGGGHRIQDGQNSRDYAIGAPLFQQLVNLSGWVPVVAAVLGAGFAANTNFAGCADFVVMVRGKAVMGLAGPALVKAGTGEVIAAEDLGGAGVQVDRNGLAHLGVANESAALAAIRDYLSYLPSNAGLPAPSSLPEEASEPDGAMLERIIPANTRRSYDVREVIARLADDGTFFEIKPTHAGNIVVGFARLEGRSVGFVANQPKVKAGMLDAAACEKGAHFIALCDAFGLPLIFLIDVPGFSIGSAAEASLLGRRSARMIHELGNATVARISVVLRKGYGLGYIAMCGGRSFGADLAIAWPGAEICAMSVEGSVDVAYRKDYASAANPTERRQQLIDAIRDDVSPLQAAAGFGLDDIVRPSETRRRIIEALATAPARQRRVTRAGGRPISPI